MFKINRTYHNFIVGVVVLIAEDCTIVDTDHDVGAVELVDLDSPFLGADGGCARRAEEPFGDLVSPLARNLGIDLGDVASLAAEETDGVLIHKKIFF